MVNYSSFKGKLIKMAQPYPVCDEDDNVIGYTRSGDMAVITFADLKKEGYFETVIVSGDFIGIDTLALNLSDITEHSVFIFNRMDDKGMITIDNKEINYEYV